jgi:hypothetical protein
MQKRVSKASSAASLSEPGSHVLNGQKRVLHLMISLSHKWKQLYGLNTPADRGNANFWESVEGGGRRGGKGKGTKQRKYLNERMS